MNMKKWKTIKTEPVIENDHIRFLVDDYEVDGQKRTYYYHANAYGTEYVEGFLQKENGNFIMLKEYRYLFDKISVAIPAGGIEKDETPDEAFVRECIEEAGYKPNKIVRIGWKASAPSISKERGIVYLATDLEPAKQKLEDNEEIDIIEMTAEQIDEAIQSGDIWDGTVISSWYLVKKHLNI